MDSTFIKIILAIVITGVTSVYSTAQSGLPTASTPETAPKTLRERLLKMRIEENKKEFNKLVKRSEEASKLAAEIHLSFKKNEKLTSTDYKKLKRVNKLLKKIRRVLGAGRDKKNDKKTPVSISVAIKSLHKHSEVLFTEIKKTTRHSISALAIQSSNNVLKLVKFLRLKK